MTNQIEFIEFIIQFHRWQKSSGGTFHSCATNEWKKALTYLSQRLNALRLTWHAPRTFAYIYIFMSYGWHYISYYTFGCDLWIALAQQQLGVELKSINRILMQFLLCDFSFVRFLFCCSAGATATGLVSHAQFPIHRYYRLWIYTCNAVLLIAVIIFCCIAGKVLLADYRRLLVNGLNLGQPSFIYAYLALLVQSGKYSIFPFPSQK